MKLNYYIPEKLKKAVAVLLLLYFAASPLLFAIPQNRCTGTCTMEYNETHTCSMEMHEGEHNCCDSGMDFSSLGNQSCDMELTHDNCMIVKNLNDTNNFVITPKYNSEQSFVVVFTFNLTSERKEFISTENSGRLFNEYKTPIYLAVHSFLI